MKRILAHGLNQNVAHWSELTLAMKWIHHAVTILDNEEELPVLLVQQRMARLDDLYV